MSVLALQSTDGYLHFDEAQAREAGRARADAYRNAQPFPHIAMDDFIDSDILRKIGSSFPGSEGKTYFDRDQERLKFQYKPHESDSALVRNLLNELNSQAFLGFLEEMTGISGLIADPYFEGGGLHEIKRGGHLGVHADFNIHGGMKVERRLNLLIYLNENWDPSFGGELELWDKAMTAKERGIAPLLGRAVVFSTTLDSYHGHPDPLACPPDRSRRSIATYYYTAFEANAAIPVRTTNFRVRPASGDKRDWSIAAQHWINDWVPPRLQRIAHRIIRP